MAAAISGLMAAMRRWLARWLFNHDHAADKLRYVGNFCVEILKFSMARKVWMPQYILQQGISRSPNKSCSIRTVISLTFSYSCVGVRYAFGTLAQFGKIVQSVRLNRQGEGALLRVPWQPYLCLSASHPGPTFFIFGLWRSVILIPNALALTQRASRETIMAKKLTIYQNIFSSLCVCVCRLLWFVKMWNVAQTRLGLNSSPHPFH